MKYEIEIELPEHLRDKWRPVAFRDAQAGECIFWLDGGVHRVSCNRPNCLVVEPMNLLEEVKTWWPKTIGFDWITRDELGVWGWFGDKPYLVGDEFQSDEHEMTSFSVVFELIGIDPPKLANPADQVWGNPWKERQ